MNFKKGDRVRFLNETGGGVIVRVEGKIAWVETGDDFEIPAKLSELVPAVDSYLDMANPPEAVKEARQQANEIEHTIIEKTPDIIDTHDGDTLSENGPFNVSDVNACMAFIAKNPRNIGSSDLNIYLVNDSPYHILFTIAEVNNGQWKFFKSGRLEPDTKLYLESVSQSAISKIKAMAVQLMFYKTGFYEKMSPIERIVQLDEYQFYKQRYYIENDYFDEDAIIIALNGNSNWAEELMNLNEADISKVIKEKEENPQNAEPKKLVKPKVSDIEEVDLHIEEITDDYINMSPGEIINMQMSRFSVSLEGAVLNKQKKIVFIHGVGNGKLKHELRKTLDNKYPHLKYQDASFKEYGYGATMVYL